MGSAICGPGCAEPIVHQQESNNETLPNNMNICGLTFEQLINQLSPRKHDIKALRAEYKTLLNGGRQTGNLTATIHPVVKQIQEGDLTKFVQRTHDGLETESVVVPMQRRGRHWKTLCVSSQIGCARGCRFCETAQLGLVRNLTTAEIVGQVVAAQRDFQRSIRNVVFMGMGEPLDNYDAVIQAIRVLNDRSGLSIGMDHIAISTVGRTHGIRKLATLGWRRLNVAVSLNAPNDTIRANIMPIAKTESMDKLREALLSYPLRNCQFFMIEYVLIPGVNDAPEHALELVEYLRPLKCVVNVIPYNPRNDSPWPAPSEESIIRFMETLQQQRQVCKLRLTKGRGQMAACGQLGNRNLLTAQPDNEAEPERRPA